MYTDFSFPRFCMAKGLKINPPLSSSSSPPSSVFEISINYRRRFLVFMGFLFILVAIVNSSSAADPPSTTHATILADSSSAAKASDFRPGERGKGEDHHKSKRSEFEAGDHEVPSGPNPISNR